MGKKKISVGTWAYIWGGYSDKPIPFPTVVKKLKELKFDGIEFGAFAPHLEPNTKEKRAEIRKMLDDAGLGISGVAAPFPSPITTGAAEYLDVVKGHLEMCKEMGIPKLRTETVDPPTGIPGLASTTRRPSRGRPSAGMPPRTSARRRGSSSSGSSNRASSSTSPAKWCA